MSEIKKLFRGTIIYLLGSVGIKLANFILLPLYTSKINPSDYGVYDLNITYSILIVSVLFLDIWNGIMKFMFEKNDTYEKNKVIYSGLTIFVSSCIIYLVVFQTLLLFIKIDYPWLVFLYGLSICLQNLFGYLARCYGFSSVFAFSGILATIITSLTSIVLLVLLKMNYQALYISFILGALFQCLYIEFNIKIAKNFKIEYINIVMMKQIFKFSIPLCVNSLCYWLLTSYGKVIVSTELSSSMNGYYSIASKFAAIMNILSSGFGAAWQELTFSKFDRSRETGKFYSKATMLYLEIMIFGVMFYYL